MVTSHLFERKTLLASQNLDVFTSLNVFVLAEPLIKLETDQVITEVIHLTLKTQSKKSCLFFLGRTGAMHINLL